MPSIHYIEFFIISLGLHIFTLFTYMAYYSDLINSNYFKDFQQEYDYIIVGAGTAGSVIAQQIATETNHSFIVLEAGGRSNSLFNMPVLGPFLHGSLYDWQFETLPQRDACLAMRDKKCKSPQGKIIGGSSALNNMIYVRGNISHYVNWFQQKYTKEYIKNKFKYLEEEILHLENVKYQSDLSDAILDAAKELGYHNNLGLDFNVGFSKAVVNQKNGKRWTSPEKSGFSTHILTNVLVNKIMFDRNKAVGISFLLSGKVNKILARKGIILSAGAYNTPKILQLSGIGPEQILKQFDIPLVKNLPVGKNLQDHVTTGLDLVQFDKPVSITAMDMVNPFHAFDYFFNGRGPLTSSGCENIGFLSSMNQTTPDLQFMVLSAGLASDRGTQLKKTVNINEITWNNYISKGLDKYVATILPVILHPKSKGEVYIQSTDPNIPPVIDPKYLYNKEDVNLLIRGLRLIKEFVETKAMRNIGAYLNENIFPGCENYDFFSNSYLECYVKHLTLTSFHPVGTCSMGLPTSENAVVDNSFKVLGVDGLYVVDASVLPTMPSGNINAAVAMMALVFFDTNIRLNSEIKTDIPFCFKKDRFYNDNSMLVCYK
ncbi:glucose dehydrogenase [FAD, quinone] [Manduca sexta]|nr:glucose dehydrogenase [FAD, quinone] [Manduca sexta]